MNDLALLRRILANPTPEELTLALEGQTVSKEIRQIAQFVGRQLLDYTGSNGPPQFKSLMVAWRLAPRDVVLSFVMECAFYALPVAAAVYPYEDLLTEF